MYEPVKEVILQIGDFYFGGGRLQISTLLGSCVSVTIWHPRWRIGGMCHYMLPFPGVDRLSSKEEPGLYAVDAVELFAKAALAAGTLPREYVVKLFGGGNMFGPAVHTCELECATAELGNCRNVGCRNVLAGRTLFGQRGFRVAVEDVGGEGSRQINFEIWTGDVWVRRACAMLTDLAAAR